MMAGPIMTKQTYIIDGRTVCVHTSPAPNPETPTLFLLHGGWGSAVMHWSPIWEALAAHVRVVAPELPGMGYDSAPITSTIPEFSQWLKRLMDYLEIEQAWVAGNSMGGALAWHLALAAHVRVVAPELPGMGYDSAPITSTIPEFSQWLKRLMDYLEIEQAWVAGNSMGGALAWHLALIAPDRVKGLVLINGAPLPPLPKNIRFLARTPPGRLLVRTVAKRVAFSPKAVASAFAHRSRIPEPLADLCRQRRPPQLLVTTDVIIDGSASKAIPSQPCLIVWGTEDRLHGNQPDQARRLTHRLHDARLVEIPDAGHMPQIEQPRLVIDTLAAFMGF